MKKISFIIISIILLSFNSISQDIFTFFRSQPLGSSVTITGIVTNGDELGPIRYVEDGTYGTALFTIYQLITYSMEFQERRQYYNYRNIS